MKSDFWNVERFEQAGQAALDCDEIVAAAYWLTLTDLRGPRNQGEEISKCVERWTSLHQPIQAELIDDDFTQYQHEFGLAVLLFFSHADPNYAITWFHRATLAGDIDARMFSFKFFGGFPTDTSRPTYYYDNSSLIAFVMVLLAIVIMFGVFIFAMMMQSDL